MAKKMAKTAELECRTPFKITAVKFSTKKVFAKKQPKTGQNGQKMAKTAELECRTPFKITAVKFSTEKVSAKKMAKKGQNG